MRDLIHISKVCVIPMIIMTMILSLVSSCNKDNTKINNGAQYGDKLDKFFNNSEDDKTSKSIPENPSLNPNYEITLEKLKILPENSKIYPGLSKEFRVLAYYSNQTKNIVTEKVDFQIEDKSLLGAKENHNNIFEGLSPGVTKVIARFEGLQVEATIQIAKNSIKEIQITPASILIGKSAKVYATAIMENGTTQDITNSVNWQILNGDYAILDPSTEGNIIGQKIGNFTIQAINDAMIGTSSITVKNLAVESIWVEADNSTVIIGNPTLMRAKAKFINGEELDITKSVTWSSDKPAIAKVDQKGLIIPKSAGEALISASFQNHTDSKNIAVTSASFTTISIEPKDGRTGLGFKKQLKAFGEEADGTKTDITELVFWSSSSKDIATISNDEGSKGIVHSKTKGEISVTARYGNRIPVTTSFTIAEAALESISISTEKSKDGACGLLSPIFKAEGTFSDGSKSDVSDKVTWVVEKSDMAKISNDIDTRGQVETLKVGIIDIKAEFYETLIGETITATDSINSTDPIIQGIDIVPKEGYEVATGRELNLNAVARYTCKVDSPKDFTSEVAWQSSLPDNFKISTSGLVKTYGNFGENQTVVVKASHEKLTGEANFTLKPAEIEEFNIIVDNPNVEVGAQMIPRVQLKYTNGEIKGFNPGELSHVKLVWSTNLDRIIVDPESGLMTGNLPGKDRLKLKVTTPYFEKTKSVEIKILSRCPESGVRSGFYCYVLSHKSQNCMNACIEKGAEYSDITETIIGSQATNGHSCSKALKDLGFSAGLNRDNQEHRQGMGCVVYESLYGSTTRRITSTETVAGAEAGNYRRVCGCEF